MPGESHRGHSLVIPGAGSVLVETSRRQACSSVFSLSRDPQESQIQLRFGEAMLFLIALW
jgi:hypothetical protein